MTMVRGVWFGLAFVKEAVESQGGRFFAKAPRPWFNVFCCLSRSLNTGLPLRQCAGSYVCRRISAGSNILHNQHLYGVLYIMKQNGFSAYSSCLLLLHPYFPHLVLRLGK